MIYTKNNRTFVLLACLTLSCNAQSWRDYYLTIKSMATFHYFVYWESRNVQTFNTILEVDNKISVTLNQDGSIASVTDNQRSAVLLGMIPHTQNDISTLEKTLCGKGKIGIYTFNKPFERKWAGLDTLLTKNKLCVTGYRYDTIDRDSPSLVDLIRVVRDLKTRNDRNENGAYVHCKAGMGRSSTGVAAYILYLAQKDNKITDVSVHAIEQYLLSKRAHVNFHPVGRAQLQNFKNLLEQKSFDEIMHEYADAIEQRENEL